MTLEEQRPAHHRLRDSGDAAAGVAGHHEPARAKKIETMRSIIGMNIEQQTLESLLSAADDDEHLALDVFFAESKRAAQRSAANAAHHIFEGPRKPFVDLALLLGNGVDPDILAPIAAEYSGDVPAAVEVYFDQKEQDLHFDLMIENAKRAAEYCESYYRRPTGQGEPVVCNVYHLHWESADAASIGYRV